VTPGGTSTSLHILQYITPCPSAYQSTPPRTRLPARATRCVRRGWMARPRCVLRSALLQTAVYHEKRVYHGCVLRSAPLPSPACVGPCPSRGPAVVCAWLRLCSRGGLMVPGRRVCSGALGWLWRGARRLSEDTGRCAGPRVSEQKGRGPRGP
jgi:hypothetical protein